MPETKGRSLEAIDKAFNERASAWSLGKLKRRRVVQQEDGVGTELATHSHGQSVPLR